MKVKILGFLLMISCVTWAQESPKEEDYYKIVTLPVPEGILLEVGGITMMLNGFGHQKRGYLGG